MDSKKKTKYIKLKEGDELRIERFRATIFPVPTFAEAARILIDKALTAAGFPPE